MKINATNIKKGLRYLKHYGLKEFMIRLEEKQEQEAVPYDEWFQKMKATEQELQQQKKESRKWKNAPKISVVVPLYQTPEKFLREMIVSVQASSYENWELCLADGTPDFSLITVVEEYQKKCLEEKTELEQFQEKYILQEPTDRADTVLRKMRNWYFEAAHQRVSPYQLLTVTEAICKELDLFYRMPEKQEKCPRPLQYRDADLFLDAFEEWIHVYRESLKSQTAGKEKMEEAISYIRENYAKDLNMAMVSNHICMNYSLFSAAFKEHTGVNFVNYLKEIRIAEAKRLLIQTEDKITEIAKQVGFENDKHFMKSFKTACGVSPSEFRKDYKMVSNGKGGQDE